MATRTNTKGSNARGNKANTKGSNARGNKANTKGSKANTKGSKAKERETIEVNSYDIKRAIECGNGAILFDLELNGVCIYGCHIAESRDGNEFIGFPSRKGNDGKYYSIAWAPLSDEDTEDIIGAVNQKLDEED